MFYLIQTAYHLRPYLTSIEFLARDFRHWGCRVIVYADNSPYIAEIRYREKKYNQTSSRVELMEHWSREIISRRQQERQHAQDRGYQVHTVSPMAQHETSTDDARLERISRLLQDFIEGVAAHGRPNTVHTAGPKDARPLPDGPLGLISKYSCLLQAVRYTSNTNLPSWTSPEFFVADQVTLDFRFHTALKKEYLMQALSRAVYKDNDRMGRVETDMRNSVLKVMLFVEVSDLVIPHESIGDDKVDPLPLYERGEKPPSYDEA